jgi:hypothetical protein
MGGRKAGYGEGTGLKEGPEYGVSRRVCSRSRDRSTAPGDWPATFRETGLADKARCANKPRPRAIAISDQALGDAARHSCAAPLQSRTDDRLRERFPIGTSEHKLIGYLVSANFVPDWRRRDEANSSLFIWNGPLCGRIVHALWQATRPVRSSSVLIAPFSLLSVLFRLFPVPFS